MRLPGFTAEASINDKTKSYRAQGEPQQASANLIRPAFACFDICVQHCGGTYACAMGCSRLCRAIRVV